MRIVSVLLALSAAAPSFIQVRGDGLVDPATAAAQNADAVQERKEEDKKQAVAQAKADPPKEDAGAEGSDEAKRDLRLDEEEEKGKEANQSTATDAPKPEDKPDADDAKEAKDAAEAAKEDGGEPAAQLAEADGAAKGEAAQEPAAAAPAADAAPAALMDVSRHTPGARAARVHLAPLPPQDAPFTPPEDPGAPEEDEGSFLEEASHETTKEEAMAALGGDDAPEDASTDAPTATTSASPSNIDDMIEEQIDQAQDEREAKVQNLPDPGKDAPEWIRKVFENVKKLMQDRADVVRDVRLVEDSENQVQNILDQAQDLVTKKKKENIEQVQQLRQLDGLLETGKVSAGEARAKAQSTLHRLVQLDRLTTWAAKQMEQMNKDVAWEQHVLNVVGDRQKTTRKVWEEQMPELAKQTGRAADVFERKTRSVLLDVKADLHSNDQVLKNLENAQTLAKTEMSSTEKQDRQNRVDLAVLEQKLKRSHETVESMANRMMRAEREAQFAEFQTRQTEGLEHMSKDYLAHTRKTQIAEREKADKLSRRMQTDTTVLGNRQNQLMSAAGQLEVNANRDQRYQQERIDAVVNR